MITVTRLNGNEIVVNALYIEIVEATPDTRLHMTNGNKINVREDVDEVIARIQTYMRSIGLMRAAISVQKEESEDD